MLRVEMVLCDLPFKKEVIGSDSEALSLVLLIKSAFLSTLKDKEPYLTQY